MSNGNDLFTDAQQLVAKLRKIFSNTNATTLCHLMAAMPEWTQDAKIKQNILDGLDNIFAYAYEEARNADAIQVLLSDLNRVFSVEQMLAAIEPGYVLNCLNRGACEWEAGQDCYEIDTTINANSLCIARIFLDFFMETNCPKQKQSLQKVITIEMQDAAFVGNWLFFGMLCEFCPLLDIAARCHEECCHMLTCVARKRWIDTNWNVSQKKRKT